MISQQKLMLLLNEPIFYKVYEREKALTENAREAAFKKIYVNQKMIRRYKALQQARFMAIEDLKVDTNLDYLITHLESVEEATAEKIYSNELEKQKIVEKFEQRQVREQQLNADMKEIMKLVKQVKDKKNVVNQLSEKVEKTMQRSEMIKALTMSNKLLKDENEKLIKKQSEYLGTIEKLKLDLQRKTEQINFLRDRKAR